MYRFQPDRPRFAITCGLPRSGKTAWAMAQGSWTRICPDDIRLAMHGERFNRLMEPYVWAMAETMARALLRGGQSAIVDATHTTRDQRAKWVRLAREFGLDLGIYWINTPYHLCMARNRGPNSIPDPIIQRMHLRFEQPGNDEGIVMIPIAHVGYIQPIDPNQGPMPAHMRRWHSWMEQGLAGYQPKNLGYLAIDPANAGEDGR